MIFVQTRVSTLSVTVNKSKFRIIDVTKTFPYDTMSIAVSRITDSRCMGRLLWWWVCPKALVHCTRERMSISYSQESCVLNDFYSKRSNERCTICVEIFLTWSSLSFPIVGEYVILSSTTRNEDLILKSSWCDSRQIITSGNTTQLSVTRYMRWFFDHVTSRQKLHDEFCRSLRTLHDIFYSFFVELWSITTFFLPDSPNSKNSSFWIGELRSLSSRSELSRGGGGRRFLAWLNLWRSRRRLISVRKLHDLPLSQITYMFFVFFCVDRT